jgi:hypothetical protein
MSQPSEDAIRQKAYLLWEADGRPFGHDHEYWQRAVVALSNVAQMQVLPKSPPKHAVEGKPKAEPKKAAAKTKADPVKAAKPAAGKKAGKPKKK